MPAEWQGYLKPSDSCLHLFNDTPSAPVKQAKEDFLKEEMYNTFYFQPIWSTPSMRYFEFTPNTHIFVAMAISLPTLRTKMGHY